MSNVQAFIFDLRMRRASLVIAAATLLLGTSLAHAVAAPSWSAPIPLAPALALINLQFDGSITLDSFGNSVAVWNANGSISAAAQASGGSYSAAVDISQIWADEQVGAPRAAVMPMGGVIAVWPSAVGNRRTGVVYYIKAASKSRNGNWSAPTVVAASTATGPAYSDPHIAVDALGNSVAVWTSCDRVTATRCVIQSAHKAPRSAWSTSVNLSTAAGNASSPQLALSPNGIAVTVWQLFTQPGISVIQSVSRQPERAWSAAVNLSSPAVTDSPRVAVDALGRATAVWTQGDAVVATTRTFNGSWSAPVSLSTSGLPSGSVDVAMDLFGNATAAWVEFDQFGLGVHLVKTANHRPGASWSAPTQISPDYDDASVPRVATSPGGLLKVVTWVDSAQNLARAATQLGTAAWSAPATLGNGLVGTQVEVAASVGSRARALWSLPIFSPRGGEGWIPTVAALSP